MLQESSRRISQQSLRMQPNDLVRTSTPAAIPISIWPAVISLAIFGRRGSQIS